jgi:hypothetical protein
LETSEISRYTDDDDAIVHVKYGHDDFEEVDLNNRYPNQSLVHEEETHVATSISRKRTDIIDSKWNSFPYTPKPFIGSK